MRDRTRQWVIGIGLLAASVPILAAAEAGLEYIRTLQGESQNTFHWMFTRFMAPWAALAVCVPIAIVLAKRFPLTGSWRARTRSIAVHTAGGIVVSVLHLGLDTLDSNIRFNANLPVVGSTAYLLSYYMLRDLFFYWAIVGVLQAVWSARALRERELRDARLETELAEARLAALQARVEPHFLFNTLNTAVMMVRDGDREQAVGVLLELSELLRAVVKQAPADGVTLDDEWRFTERYLALEQLRFGDRLTVQLARDNRAGSTRVPFLILQPLVENALRHGIAARPGAGRLEVQATRTRGTLRITVRDESDAALSESASTHGNGVGLSSVRARLREMYDDRAELRLERTENGGTLATILIDEDYDPPIAGRSAVVREATRLAPRP